MYRVIRSWPGVKRGDVIPLGPARAEKLLKGGFVKKVQQRKKVE